MRGLARFLTLGSAASVVLCRRLLSFRARQCRISYAALVSAKCRSSWALRSPVFVSFFRNLFGAALCALPSAAPGPDDCLVPGSFQCITSLRALDAFEKPSHLSRGRSVRRAERKLRAVGGSSGEGGRTKARRKLDLIQHHPMSGVLDEYVTSTTMNHKMYGCREHKTWTRRSITRGRVAACAKGVTSSYLEAVGEWKTRR